MYHTKWGKFFFGQERPAHSNAYKFTAFPIAVLFHLLAYPSKVFSGLKWVEYSLPCQLLKTRTFSPIPPFGGVVIHAMEVDDRKQRVELLKKDFWKGMRKKGKLSMSPSCQWSSFLLPLCENRPPLYSDWHDMSQNT